MATIFLFHIALVIWEIVIRMHKIVGNIFTNQKIVLKILYPFAENSYESMTTRHNNPDTTTQTRQPRQMHTD